MRNLGTRITRIMSSNKNGLLKLGEQVGALSDNVKKVIN